MEHITVGRKFNKGKIAYVECVQNGSLKDISIQDTTYLLIVLTAGQLTFELHGEMIRANAPCFICFDEAQNPRLLSQNRPEYYCIYFHPQFLNPNMTFELVRSRSYTDIATTHDLFLMKPFLDGFRVIPIRESHRQSIEVACAHMEEELCEQRDWYWSCRSRSYFMEVMIALERMYGMMGYGEQNQVADMAATVNNAKVRETILYIEGHYMEQLTLADISAAVGINHTSLTTYCKQELGVTVMGYLLQFRLKVAKKQLAFSIMPIKEIVHRCGFKTVQHFTRVFKQHVGSTPDDYRKAAIEKRKQGLSNR